jgi:protein-L-isoaspartate(D-aspartate) O-methyltransferase
MNVLPLAVALSLAAAAPPADRHAERRRAMVEEQLAGRGIRDPATLGAMRAVPRHEFVPAELADRAYGDHPLPIGLGQTISQPYIVGYMTELIRPRPGLRVLEVGTGSGYHASVMAEAGCTVFTMEIFAELASTARARVQRLGIPSVTVRHGDGNEGWSDAAPFDAIVVTAAGSHVPPALVDQLKPGGKMVLPVGSMYGVQHLTLVEKDGGGTVRTRTLLPVAFVPLLRGLR